MVCVTSLNKKSLSLFRLQRNVLIDLSSVNIFGEEEHQVTTQDGIDNHYLSLIREAIKIYFNVRVQHIVKMHNIKVKGRNDRPMYTKTILYKGQ